MGFFNQVNMDFVRKRAALKWGECGPDVLSFSVADIDFPAPPEVKAGIIQALQEDRTPYGSLGGDQDVLEVVCDKLRRVNHIPAEPADVHMIPGTMFAIFMACYHALRPGDEALICPAPVYPPFIQNVRNAGARPVFNPLDFSRDGRLDFELLRRQITPRTRLLMVCNPHNPTGRVLSRDELEEIGRIACERDLMIFCDELYEDMVLDGEHTSLASLSEELFERTLTVFGFSKAFGIPGFRIAYMVNRGRHMEWLKDRMHDIIVHADTLAQAAAKAAITAGGPWLTEFRQHLREARDYGLKRLAAIPGVTCLRPQATPFLFPDLSGFGMGSLEMTDYLHREARVVVQSGADFGPDGEGHVRINYATSLAVLAEGFDRMEAALGKLIR